MGDDWAPGDIVLDLYEVRDVVRTGGMGLVYRVRHRDWDVDLAVKTPRAELVASAEDLAAFEAEADTWVALGAHPHTVTCVYVRRIDAVPRVFAEWVDGGTVADAVRDRRLHRDGVGRMLDVAIQAAWGLDHAHRQGLIHQDVKPANVMLADDGTAKVTDFGLARARAVGAGTGAGPLVTVRGMTPAYCSPEQARGERLGVATDVWSWALTVLEMFVGRPPVPYGPAGAEALAHLVRTGAGDPAIPPLPAPLAALLARCLAHDPGARPAGMAEIATELLGIHHEVTGAPYPRDLPEPPRLLADGLSNQALSLLDLGNPERADELWQRALEADPRHPHATYNRGLRRWRAGTLTDRQLVAELDGVRSSDGGREIGDHLLALVHLERGDRDAAEALLRTVPDSAEADEARATARRLPAPREPVTLPGGDITRRAVVALSAGGRVAVTSYEARSLRVWEVDSGQLLRTLTGHDTDVESVALSADGRVAASGDSAGHILIWDTGLGRCTGAHRLPPHGLETVALSADGRVLVTAGRDGSVRVLDDLTGGGFRLIAEPFGDYGPGFGGTAAITADGRHVAAFDGHRWLLRIWDLRTGELVGNMDGLNRRFAFSPGGACALALTDDDQVRVLDLVTWAVADKGSAAGWGGGPVAVTDDGRTGLGTDWQFGLQTWQLDGNRCRHTSEPYTAADVVISADGRVALVSVGRETVRLVWPPTAGPAAPWSYTRPRQPRQLTDEAAAVRVHLAAAERLIDDGDHAAAFDRLRSVRELPGYRRDADLLASWHRVGAASTRAKFAGAWRTATHERLVRGVSAVSADLRVVISGDYFGAVTIRDLESGRAVEGSHSHGAEIRQVAVCADGRHAVTEDVRAAFVWDLVTGRRTAVLSRSGDAVLTLDSTVDPHLTLTRTPRGPTWLWHTPTRRPLYVWPGPGDQAAVLAGDVAATLDEQGRARVWAGRTRRHLHTVSFPLVEVGALVLGADGRVIAVADHTFVAGGAVFVAHLDAVAPRGVTIAQDSVNRLALTPDGSLLLSGGMDHRVQLWDPSTGERICELEGNTEAVFQVALSADGGQALSVDNLGTVLRWDLDWDYHRPGFAH
ncbi:protein kinase domain-containing protein [Micromonospora sp. SL4-19]|uniref:protein kinase domain-containing protein n=1 Tax=Micromonospora sp. SL4-19 TaxID=3399129 RepID=UPI003A4D7DFC